MSDIANTDTVHTTYRVRYRTHHIPCPILEPYILEPKTETGAPSYTETGAPPSLVHLAVAHLAECEAAGHDEPAAAGEQGQVHPAVHQEARVPQHLPSFISHTHLSGYGSCTAAPAAKRALVMTSGTGYDQFCWLWPVMISSSRQSGSS